MHLTSLDVALITQEGNISFMMNLTTLSPFLLLFPFKISISLQPGNKIIAHTAHPFHRIHRILFYFFLSKLLLYPQCSTRFPNLQPLFKPLSPLSLLWIYWDLIPAPDQVNSIPLLQTPHSFIPSSQNPSTFSICSQLGSYLLSLNLNILPWNKTPQIPYLDEALPPNPWSSITMPCFFSSWQLQKLSKRFLLVCG